MLVLLHSLYVELDLYIADRYRHFGKQLEYEKQYLFSADASTDELNPLVCITFIPTAYHARNYTEDG